MHSHFEKLYQRFFPNLSQPMIQQKAERAVEWCHKNACELVPLSRPCFGRLQTIFDCPSFIFAQGRLEMLERPCLAIVGTRRPSPYGRRAAQIFSENVARAGGNVVSGLARGIDAEAHESALRVEDGGTIGVLAHGLDQIYPSAHRSLAERIRATGLLLSEYPPGVPPLKHHFPSRNRLISGVSLGVIVVEAASKSGSLITARCAMDQGREVFVVPGSFDAVSFAGSHELIQEGAKLVRNLKDVLEELPPMSSLRPDTPSNLSGAQKILQIRNLFETSKGALSLEEVYENLRSGPPALTQEWQLALEGGWVKEVTPQQFIWTKEFF